MGVCPTHTVTVPQHIGLVTVGGAAWMGGANYVRHLAAALHAAAPGTQTSFICGDTLLNDWREVQPRIDVLTRSTFLRQLWNSEGTLRRAVQRAGIEFVYPITYDNQYNLGMRFPIGKQLGGAAWCGWIPDFQHRYLPQLFAPEEIRQRENGIAQLIEEAPRVVLSSRNAAADFCRFYPAYREKAEVLTFATMPMQLSESSVPAASNAPDRFFLVCNQFWKHKNHQVVFDALRLLRKRGVTPTVLCTGRMDDLRDRTYGDALRAALSNDCLDDQVRLLGIIPRTEQIALMRRALAVIQPSLFEGWSSVVEDARALGRPCLLSDLPVHREQNPPGARFFPPTAPEVLADLLAEAFLNWRAGPDLAAEAVAQEDARTRLRDVGMNFLRIAAIGNS